MIGGFWPLNIFAAAWGIGALVAAGAPSWSYAGPVLLSVLIIAAAYRWLRQSYVFTPEQQRRIGRTVILWSGLELVAILVAVNVLANTGHGQLVGGAVAAIVGLHFFPLAHGLGLRLYYLTGLVLTALGLAGMAAVTVVTPLIVFAGAAGALWLTCVILLTVPAARVRTGP